MSHAKSTPLYIFDHNYVKHLTQNILRNNTILRLQNVIETNRNNIFTIVKKHYLFSSIFFLAIAD